MPSGARKESQVQFLSDHRFPRIYCRCIKLGLGCINVVDFQKGRQSDLLHSSRRTDGSDFQGKILEHGRVFQARVRWLMVLQIQFSCSWYHEGTRPKEDSSLLLLKSQATRY